MSGRTKHIHTGEWKIKTNDISNSFDQQYKFARVFINHTRHGSLLPLLLLALEEREEGRGGGAEGRGGGSEGLVGGCHIVNDEGLLSGLKGRKLHDNIHNMNLTCGLKKQKI